LISTCLIKLDLEHHVVVDAFLLGLGRGAELGVEVQVEALVILKIALAEDLIAGKVVEGGEDVLQPQDGAEQLDEGLLRRFAGDRGAQREQRLQLGDLALVFAVILGVGLEQHDALGILVAEQGQGIIGSLLQVAEGDDVAVGLDRIEDAVGARIAWIRPWAFRFLSTHRVFSVVASKPVRNMLTTITRSSSRVFSRCERSL